jgi:hypothetical protein
MSKGALIIAKDIEQIEYVRMARVAARLVTRNLGIPVALVTDEPCDHPEFEHVIVAPKGHNNHRTTVMNNQQQTLSWYNMDRTRAYELSPWDRTLVLDSDMFLTTDALKSHIDADFDFAIAKSVLEPNTGMIHNDMLSNTKIRHMWATIMIFNKCPKAEAVFDMAAHVINHYDSYARIYDFKKRPIRNDNAFSIACHLLGGYGATDMALKNYVMNNVNFTSKIRKILPEGRFVIEYDRMIRDQVRTIVQKLPPGDHHILNKLSLMEHINELEQI